MQQTQKRYSTAGALETLSGIAHGIAAATPDGLDTAIERGLCKLGQFAGIDRSFLIAFSADKQTFTMTHEWCSTGIHAQIDYFVNLPISVFPWTAHQLLAGKYVATHHLDDYPEEAEQERQICISEGIQSIIFLPLLSRGEVIGTIGFDAIRTTCRWTPTLIRVLETAGALFSASLEQRRADTELQHIAQLERRKLGHDLHDSLSQSITAISFCAGALKKKLASECSQLVKRAEQIEIQARATLNSVRDITRGLKTFDVLGFPVNEILTQMTDETQRQTGVDCTFVDEGVPPIEDPETCTQLLWMTREAINNAIRHGGANHIRVGLGWHGDKLCLTVDDDGSGLPADFLEKEGVGLKVMRFRAAAMGGLVTITPGEVAGTRIRCVFPNRKTLLSSGQIPTRT